ncbi:hypothetical protein BY458DRAFT_496091 [Sporodiniella umbellata]|nr:hypothetical protein BY458DRAFT_496091 [Sporodiniella umbellata]
MFVAALYLPYKSMRCLFPLILLSKTMAINDRSSVPNMTDRYASIVLVTERSMNHLAYHLIFYFHIFKSNLAMNVLV